MTQSLTREHMLPAIGIFCRDLKKRGDPSSKDYYWQAYKLVELNSYLGLMPASDDPEAQKTIDKLANYLIGCIPKERGLLSVSR